MYVSIALILCSWILIYAGGSMQVDRLLAERLKATRELMELQKEAARDVQRVSFDLYQKLKKEEDKQKKEDDKSKKEIGPKELDKNSPKKEQVKTSAPTDENEAEEENKSAEIPVHRVSFFQLMQSQEPSRLEEGFLCLWQDVLLQNISISQEEKARFANEVLKAVKKIDPKGKDLCLELEKLEFEKESDRELYCTLLRSNPSPIDFITLEKRPISFFNLDPRALKALFPEIPDGHLEHLRKKTAKSQRGEVRIEIEKILGESIEESKDPLLTELEFVPKKQRDKACYTGLSKDGGMRLWRITID